MPLKFRKFSVLQPYPRAMLKLYQAVRAYFGLKQDDFSFYLDVPRATLSLAELGRGSLPAEATRRLLPFLEHLPRPEAWPGPADAAVPPPPLTPAGQETLNFRLLTCRHEAQRLRRQLERQQLRLQQARRCLQVLPALRATLPADAGPDHDQVVWLRLFERRAQRTVDGYDAAAAALLELRIAALTYEATFIAERLPAGPEDLRPTP